MDRLTHLFLGVIVKPEKTFLEIKETRPIRGGLFIMIASIISYLLLLFQPSSAEIIIPKIEEGKTYFILSYCLGAIVPFIFAWILNYFARSAKLESTYTGILNVFLFSYVTTLVLFPFLFLAVILKMKVFYGIVSWAASLWGIILVVIGISATLLISKRQSVSLYLRAFLILLVVFLIIGVLGGFIESKIKREEKINAVLQRLTDQNQPYRGRQL